MSCHGPLYDLVHDLGFFYNGNGLSLLRDWQERPVIYLISIPDKIYDLEPWKGPRRSEGPS